MDWIICFVIASVFIVASVIGAFIFKYPLKWRFWSAVVGLFAAVYALLLPYYWGLEVPGFNKLLLAFHGSAQVFTLNIDSQTIVEEIARQNLSFGDWYLGMLSALVMVCPLMTASLILSFVKNFWQLIRLRLFLRKRLHIFSECNEMTIALAESIAKQKSRNNLLVFADCKDEESEIYERAKQMHAICLSKPVTTLPTWKHRKTSVTFYLANKSESESLSLALELSKHYENRRNTNAFLFASSAASAYLVDSFPNGTVQLSKALMEQIRDHPATFWADPSWARTELDISGGFYLKRVDSTRFLTLKTLTDPSLLTVLKETTAQGETECKRKHISLLIVGFGRFGKELLKTAVWLYQLNGYCVDITVVDRQPTETILQQLNHECPELIKFSGKDFEGEACYNIHIEGNTDCFSSKFDQLYNQINSIQAAFVALGDDDCNIEAAISLRTLYDRNRETEKGKNPAPRIFAVVFDDTRMHNLENGLHNHKEQDYHVQFIGSLSEMYSLQALDFQEKLEQDAILRHVDWMRTGPLIRDNFEKNQQFALLLQKKFRDYGMDLPLVAIHGMLDSSPDEGALCQSIAAQLQAYYQFEYYRSSSVSTYLHKTKIAPFFLGDSPKKDFICDGATDCETCGYCDKWRKTEHMRWNAYMRSIGFQCGPRFDRGKRHHNLVPWQELDPLSIFKD